MAPLARAAACAAAALLPGAAALRSRSPEMSDRPTYQVLQNNQDLQYFGDITIGGQTLAGILDTGSFELVVFSQECNTCGIAGKYKQSKSRTYSKGNLTQLHAYGSGECMAADGFDRVEVAGIGANHQALWITTECKMPLLQQASFNSIVGIGPPGEPVITAREELEYLEDELRRAKAMGMIPEDLVQDVAKAKSMLAAAKAKPSLLENMGVTSFSQCLGKPIGSPGLLIWNDKTPFKARAGMVGSKRLQVVPDIFWGVASKDLGFAGKTSALNAGCAGGCYAIVDTGTSLFAVPSNIYASVFDVVDRWMETNLPASAPADCSDISAFPNLVLTVSGHKLSFPPSSYIGSYTGFAKKGMERFVRTDRFKKTGCQLLLMDLGFPEVNQYGPMIILGMPFMREYYTTFDLGSFGGAMSRSIFVQKAGTQCEQAAAGNTMTAEKERGSAEDEERREREYAYVPRKVDASQLRVPHWVDRFQAKAKAEDKA